MGNQNSTGSQDQCIFLHSQMHLKSMKNIIKKKKKKKKKTDDRVHEQFIIDLHRSQIKNAIGSANEWIVSDSRRLVFVSLLGLFQTWRLCPAAALYSAIFILPLKREWIYEPCKYEQEIRRSLVGELSIFQDDFDSFLRLLRWKDHQNLAFWISDTQFSETCTEFENDLVRPFWRHFSKSLTNLYDPVSGRNLKPLKFNQKWWQFTYRTFLKSKFNVPPHKILGELYFVTKNFKAIQEIIYQSNPDSLNPVIAYNAYKNMTSSTKSTGFVSKMTSNQVDHSGFVAVSSGCCPDIMDVDKEEGTWMISIEYDENDLSECRLSI